jgi:hypothetical protein
MATKNVLGGIMITCSLNPTTGFYRDGCCESKADDTGEHTVCIQASKEFLNYSKSKGNDLSTPMPEYHFEGVKPGDSWCLCASRWMQAFNDGMAPKIWLEATNEKMLEHISLTELQKFAAK